MCLEEPRVLPDDVHDVRGYHCLVVFSALDFAKTQKIFDDRDQEPFFCLFIWEENDVSPRPDVNRNEVHVLMAPEMEPMAQHSVFKFCHDHSDPSTCFASFSVRMVSVSLTSRCVK